MAILTANLDDDQAQPSGDTGDRETGVPSDEQGISNRAGDEDDEELDDDEDAEDEDEDRESKL